MRSYTLPSRNGEVDHICMARCEGLLAVVPTVPTTTSCSCEMQLFIRNRQRAPLVISKTNPGQIVEYPPKHETNRIWLRKASGTVQVQSVREMPSDCEQPTYLYPRL